MSGKSPEKTGKKRKAQTGTAALQNVAELIKSGKARNIVVLTGAGISTSAGIPDFRSPETGLYANLQALNLPFPEAVFELNFFRSNPKPFWTLAKELYPGKHFPTPTHYFIKLLDDKGVLKRVFTQNIDTLEHLTSLPSDKIIEAHGSFASAHCLSCGAETSTEYVLASGVRKGEVVHCAEEGCDGLVKPDIVFFGEGLPDKFFKRLGDLPSCDLVIVIGTSLQVQPFALLPERTSRDTPRLLINREAVGPFEALDSGMSGGIDDHLARIMGRSGTRPTDMFYKGDADDGVRRLCEEMGWGDDLDRLIREGHGELEKKWKSMEKAAGTGEEEAIGILHKASAEEGAQSVETKEETAGQSHRKVEEPKAKDEDAADDDHQPDRTTAGKAADEVEKVLEKSTSEEEERKGPKRDVDQPEVDDLQQAIQKGLKL